MKKDIRSFKSEKERLNNEKAADIFDQLDDSAQREINTIEQMLHKYEGKTEAELMRELTRMADAERKNGALNDERLDAFARNISPMLTKEQQTRLSSLIDQLKS